jgi:hypothetical protein
MIQQELSLISNKHVASAMSREDVQTRHGNICYKDRYELKEKSYERGNRKVTMAC